MNTILSSYRNYLEYSYNPYSIKKEKNEKEVEDENPILLIKRINENL